MSTYPLVSIAMTTFNGEKFIQEQLESIFNQTYTNIELIVCDDKSSDATIEILKQYQKKYEFELILNEKQLGVVKNFEKVLEHCKGEYIALADQDDVWDKIKVEKLYSEISSNILIHCDARLIDENGKVFSNSYSKLANKKFRKNTYEYFFNNDVTGCTCLFKKELLDTALPFPKDILVHDWWLSICASKLGTVQYFKEPLISYRQHAQNQIGAADISKVYSYVLREKAYQKTLLFLESLYNEKKWDDHEREVLKDLINYYHAYFSDTIRIRSFLIHLKYFNLFHNDKNIIYRLFGLLLSIFGGKVQKKLWRIINK